MSIISINSRWGRTYFEGKDEYVGRSLYNYGEYGPDETEKILSLASGLCLDIGANFGCIGQALEHNGFEVIAFEPQPYIYGILRKNLQGTCHNVALGSIAGTAKMPRLDNGARYNYGGMGLGMVGDRGTIQVEVRTLDSYGLSPGFIKMDVEGFEREVLLGGSATIARCRPIMYIEDDRPERSVALRKCVTDMGYTIEEHNPTLYRPENFFGKRVNVWNKNYISKNIICRPC